MNTSIYRYTISEGQLTRNRNKKAMRRMIAGYEQIFDIAKKNQQSICNDTELSQAIDR